MPGAADKSRVRITRTWRAKINLKQANLATDDKPRNTSTYHIPGDRRTVVWGLVLGRFRLCAEAVHALLIPAVDAECGECGDARTPKQKQKTEIETTLYNTSGKNKHC